MKNVFKLKALSAIVAAGLMMGAGAASAQVVGGGATLPENLYNEIFTTTPLPGFNEYIGVGSGAGKRAFFNNNSTEFGLASGITVDYAGSDSLVTVAELATYNTASNPVGVTPFGPVIQAPAVLTSVTVPYNVTGISDLDLTSEQLALIFSGEVDTWNDPRLGLGLPTTPDRPITVVYRPDGSGTTEIFARHLNDRAPDEFTAVSNVFWTAIGAANEAALPANFLPSTTTVVVDGEPVSLTGSAGVPNVVYNTADSIGYVSPDYTEEDDNEFVAQINGLLPTQVNVQAALEDVDVPTSAAQRSDPLAWGISNSDPSQGYSFVASTNLIVGQCYLNAGDRNRVIDALNKLYTGQFDAAITAHGFIPLPAEWRDAVHETFVAAADPLNLDLNIGNSAECSATRGRPNVN